MKQMEMETEGGNAKVKEAGPPPPPPPPPLLPNLWVARKTAGKTISRSLSVTNQEIAKFWRQKRMEEEDHLLAAIKAAAHIRACKLSEDDYRCFEESLKDDEDSKAGDTTTETSGKKNGNGKELRVGIKDWWTKSKYAYLNQPAIDSMDNRKGRTSTYIPHFCNFKPALPPTTSFGIF